MDYDTVLWKVSWNNLIMMMADMPHYEYKKEEKQKVKEEEIDDFTQLIGRI